MVRFSSHFTNRFVAPKFSHFTGADIPDMSEHDPESAHWLSNYILNSGFRGRATEGVHAYFLAFIRRAEGAFHEHAGARQATLAYLSTFEPGRVNASGYFNALLHWEYFLGQAWQSLGCLRGLSAIETGKKVNIFEGEGGPLARRLHSLYTSSKHLDSWIASNRLPEDATTPIWMVNEGLSNQEHILTFTDTADVLEDIASWASALVDPRTMREKLMRHPGR